jgi:hypothetical protein
VEIAGNNPELVIEKLKDAGVIVKHKDTMIKHARSAMKMEVDILSI